MELKLNFRPVLLHSQLMAVLSPGIRVKTAKAAAERPNCLHPAIALVAQVAVEQVAMTAAGFSAALPATLAAGFHNPHYDKKCAIN